MVGVGAVKAIRASVSTSLAWWMSRSRHDRLGSVIQTKFPEFVISPQHDAGETLTAIDREQRFHPCEMAGEAVPVLRPGQRAVDAGN